MSMIPFEALRALYRLPIDSPEVSAFLAQFPEHKVDKPSDGSQYVSFKKDGVSMLFRALPGAEKGKAKKRVLITIFLYPGGSDGYERFGDLPFGLAFGDSREEMHRKLGEPFDSAAQRGIKGLIWEKWQQGDLTVHTRFNEEMKQGASYSISVAELSIK